MAYGAPALPSSRSSAPAQTLQEAKANRMKVGRYKERGGRKRERERERKEGGVERERKRTRTSGIKKVRMKMNEGKRD